MTKIIFETATSQAKRVMQALYPRRKNLSKEEIGDYFEAIEARLVALESKE